MKIGQAVIDTRNNAKGELLGMTENFARVGRDGRIRLVPKDRIKAASNQKAIPTKLKTSRQQSALDAAYDFLFRLPGKTAYPRQIARHVGVHRATMRSYLKSSEWFEQLPDMRWTIATT